MALNKQQTNQVSDGQTRILPKNFRQIGEPGSKKIYMEDYVYTYLNKLAQPGNLYARGAILFGKMYKTAVGNCLFISGAAAWQNFEFDLEDTTFSEENWSEVYRIRDSFFPDLEIAGWFLSRMGFSVELNDKIIRTHMDNFNGENKVLYMVDALENEDAFYQFENYSLKKQRGYYIYYEANKEMKDYMLAEGEMEREPEQKRKSTTILRDASVVKNYKKALKQKKTLKKKNNRTLSPSSLAGAVVMIMVLLYGLHSVRQFRQEEKVAEVFEQQNANVWNDGSDDVIKTTESTQSSDAEDEKETDGKKNWDEGNKTTEAGIMGEETTGTGTIEEEVTGAGDTENSAGAGTATTGAGNTDTNTDVFTQEEPDDITEAWSYIGGQYTVEQGDTLAGISKKIYQSYDYISAIAEANQIKDVNQIYPGQILNIPPIED